MAPEPWSTRYRPRDSEGHTVPLESLAFGCHDAEARAGPRCPLDLGGRRGGPEDRGCGLPAVGTHGGLRWRHRAVLGGAGRPVTAREDLGQPRGRCIARSSRDASRTRRPPSAWSKPRTPERAKAPSPSRPSRRKQRTTPGAPTVPRVVSRRDAFGMGVHVRAPVADESDQRHREPLGRLDRERRRRAHRAHDRDPRDRGLLDDLERRAAAHL